MKTTSKLLLMGLLSVMFMFSYAQEDVKLTREQKKAEKAIKKKEKEAKEATNWVLLQSLAENKRFVAEFDKVVNSLTGEQYILSSRLNFVAVDGDHVVIQFQTHTYLSDNGLGGRTIDGTISDYKYTPPKNSKSPIVISFNVSSEHTFRGSNVRITVTEDGLTTISLGSSPNIYGVFVSPEDANINIGVKMWN
ncbi:MAG: DUF4251 domain-containing protein [Bacteroidetes bacterium]|nr:DUF4251 domain-containing protein [Bacteroidota bacterium]